MPSIAAHITPLGPLIDVFVGVSGPRSNALTSAGQTVPQPVRARLLVDTGASQTVIDKSALQKLGLTPTGVAQIHTPSTQGVPHQVNEYDVFLGIPGQTTLAHLSTSLAVLDGDFDAQGIEGLLGRDILSNVHMTYCGTVNWFMMSF
jgi:hypothetical protein